MYRANQYSRGYRFSGFVRNRTWSADRYRKPRICKSSWKTSSWKSGGNFRRPSFKTRYLNEVLPLSVSTGAEIIHSGYVSMPDFGSSYGSRKKKFILLKGVEMQGTFRTRAVPLAAPVDSKEIVLMEVEKGDPSASQGKVPTSGLDGMVTLFTVLDKRPRGDVLSKFEDIFQWKDGGFRGDACLKNSSLERYSLVMKKRNVFHCKESTTMITFRVSYVPKEKIWVKFHDYDNDNRAGNFKNISANCLLYYVVYECHTHNIFSPNVNSCISY